MDKLKEMLEKLGETRKKLSQFTNERAEIIAQLTDLSKKDDLGEEEIQKFEQLKNQIDSIDKKIDVQQVVADNLKEQVNQIRQNRGNEETFRFSGIPESRAEENELSKFSLTKAIRDSINTGRPQGFEAEIVEEGRKEMAQIGQTSEGNIVLPTKLLDLRSPVNALTATGGTAGEQGGVTIQTDVLSLIDILRSKMPFIDSDSGAGLGATFWTGLSGNVTFPRATEDNTDLTVRTENQEAQEVGATFDSISLSPKRRAGFAEVSRQLILQSTVAVENWLRNYLMYKLAKSANKDIIDYLLGLAGTHAIENGDDGGALTWAKIVAFETAIEDADAEEEERFGFLTNAKVKGKLKTTLIDSSTAAQFIWSKDSNVINNYPAFTSNLVPKNLEKGSGEDLSAMIFANWASLYIGMWGPIEMLVNPYSKDTQGLIRLNIWNFMDKVVRRPESFAVSKDIETD